MKDINLLAGWREVACYRSAKAALRFQAKALKIKGIGCIIVYDGRFLCLISVARKEYTFTRYYRDLIKG